MYVLYIPTIYFDRVKVNIFKFNMNIHSKMTKDLTAYKYFTKICGNKIFLCSSVMMIKTFNDPTNNNQCKI